MVMTCVWGTGCSARYMTSGTIASYTREEDVGGRNQLKEDILASLDPDTQFISAVTHNLERHSIQHVGRAGS
jgi:hypothetical protein